MYAKNKLIIIIFFVFIHTNYITIKVTHYTSCLLVESLNRSARLLSQSLQKRNQQKSDPKVASVSNFLQFKSI